LGLLAALQFLTILPIRRDFTNEQIGRATVWFPVVGIIIGLILLGLNYVFRLILPGSVVSVLLLAALVILSGGLHLDGLADTMDGMAGHRTPERRLEIMRDSRIGGMGAVGLVIFLILEYISLNSIPPKWVPFTLLAAPTMSRWAMIDSIYFFLYARQSGLGSPFKQSVKWQHFLIATLVTLLVAILLFRVIGLIVMAVTWLMVTLAAFYFKHQLNGLTGDTYGAINEIAFTSVLLVISVLAYKYWPL
jgi:adenosylcobinamide-GDP ribazoletransferase